MIYHWCPRELRDAAGDEYSAPSRAAEGFIHFSYLDQVERTATDLDRGREGLVLLRVGESRLEVVVEEML